MRSRSLVAALGLTAVLALPALADIHVTTTAPAPPTITFTTEPPVVAVPNSRVYVVRQDVRPDYDMFRYGNNWYVYDNGYWYRATDWNGTYTVVNQRSVPMAFRTVPRTEWRSYPTTWTTVTTRRHVVTHRTSARAYAPGQVKKHRVKVHTHTHTEY